MGTDWRTDPDVGAKDLIPMNQMKNGDIAEIRGNVMYSQYNLIVVIRDDDEFIGILNHYPLKTVTWNKYCPLKVRIYKPCVHL